MNDQAIDFKKLDKSIRKQKVIETASYVFQKKGYRTATLDDVAYELGVTKAALYYYFSSKEEILSTIYVQAIENALKHARQIAEIDLAPPEKVRSFIKTHIEKVIIDNLPAFAVFFSEENQLPDEDFIRIRKAKKEYNQIVQQMIQDGIDKGYFRDMDVVFLSNALLSLCNSLYRWYRPGRKGHDGETIVNQIIAFLENGYLLSEYRKDFSSPAPIDTGDHIRKSSLKKKLQLEMARHQKRISRLLGEI